MGSFYLPLKWVHVSAVMLSGSVFLVRGLAVIAGQQWPLRPWLRFASIGIDTVLLTAALLLVWMLPSAVFANGWLTAKLVLLGFYVVLGTLALKRARSQHIRVLCFVAALLSFSAMVSIARAHDPWAPLRWLIG